MTGVGIVTAPGRWYNTVIERQQKIRIDRVESEGWLLRLFNNMQ